MNTGPLDTFLDHALAIAIKAKAAELGFDLVGIASAEASRHRDYFRQWLDAGSAGEMTFLHERFEERTDPAVYQPGAASVICVAINYHVPLDPVPEDQAHRQGRVARYALGNDYHALIKEKLHALADWMRQARPEAQTRASVDTAPVMEREFAARAGVGWVGKNTCIINPRVGSWLLLGQIVTTLPLPVDAPVADHCGSCTRCLDACPTGAITAPHQLDPRRCIAYLTIEHRGEVPVDLQPQIGDWLFGCDVCQDVCPHNTRAPTATDPALQPRFGTGTLDAYDVREWTPEEYRHTLRHSAMKRAKLPILQRNAETVIANLERRSATESMTHCIPAPGVKITLRGIE